MPKATQATPPRTLITTPPKVPAELTQNLKPEPDFGPHPERAIPPADPDNLDVSEDDIRQLAYRKWEEAGRPDGDGTEFWLQAERELKHSFHD
jgi:hypothetical protein